MISDSEKFEDIMMRLWIPGETIDISPDGKDVQPKPNQMTKYEAIF